MQLLYLWAEEYKCLSNANMNFCEYPRFNYNPEENLLNQISKSKPSTTMFPLPILDTKEKSDCIDNISAVVGSNGSGKTSVCSLLRDIFCNEYNEKKYIIIFKLTDKDPDSNADKEYTLYKTNIDNISINTKEDLRIFDPDNNKFKIIYYSPFYSTNHLFNIIPLNPDYFIDCSTSNKLTTDITTYIYPDSSKNYENTIDLLSANNYMDYSRCISVLTNLDHFYRKVDKDGNPLFKLGTTLPQKVHFYYDKNVFKFFDIEKKEDFPDLYEFYTKIQGNLSSLEIPKQYFIDKCSLAIFCSFSRVWFTHEFNRRFNNQISNICKRLNSINLDNKNLTEVIKEAFSILYEMLYEIRPKAVFTHTCKNILSFIEYLETIEASYFEPDRIILDIKEESKTIIWLYAQYQHIKEITGFVIFSFYPHPSSGEFSELLIYGRLFDAMSSLIRERDTQNVLLFFDEIEITLHPELQRQLIMNICTFLQSFYEDLKFQIIFATHSPVILSDIPKTNVMFLEKKEGEFKSKIKNADINSFAGNIGEMYYENFFMQETIGALAKYEIKNVLESIKNKEFEHAEYIINSIGDELLKRVLQNKLEERKWK